MSLIAQQPSQNWTRLFWVCTGLMFLYYVTDSAMDALLFNEGTVTQQLFSPERHELAIRILSGTFLFIFFLYAKHLSEKNRLLQEKFLNLSEELISANQEREAFIYSFSHEMRTSLTCIYAAEQLLSDKFSDNLNTEGRMLINQINDICEKMSSQIDEVLEYSQAIRSKLDRKRVSLNQIIKDVAPEVIAGVTDMTVSIEIERNLIFDCDPDLMRLAIRNLCRNAVNLSRPDSQAQIAIGAEIRNGKRTFFVRRINRRDKREDENPYLNNSSESIEKSRLTTVKTIIERHGGEMWTENTDNFGSTFCFTL